MATSVEWFTEGQRIITRRGGLPKALGTFVSLAVEAASADAGSFYVVDRDLNVLVPYVTVGLPPLYVKHCGHIALGDQCCGRAALHKKPWIVSDMLSDPLFATAQSAAQASPVRSAFSVPVLREDGECIGSLACHYLRTRTPSAQDIVRNKLWADLIAFTIQESGRGESAEGKRVASAAPASGSGHGSVLPSEKKRRSG